MPALAPDRPAPPAPVLPPSTRVVFVTNFAPHYRISFFEALSGFCDLRCYFYSDGGEWYWQRAHGVNRGRFRCQYFDGFWLGRVRVAPALAAALWSRRCDVIVKCINSRFALPLAYLTARLRRVPFLLWTGVWCRLATPFHRLLFPLVRRLYRSADAIVVYGEHVRRYLAGEGVDPERIFMAPQAVDNTLYRQTVPADQRRRLRDALAVGPDRKVLLFVGRLEPVKGLEYLLDAFALSSAREPVLVVCGSGSLAAKLRARAERLGISDRVCFAGYVPPGATVRFYSIAWAAVLPSISTPGGRETWGLVANEAFNQGVPLIATEAVGAVAGGLVRHLETGLVTPERDARALARAIDRLFQDAALRHRLSENARAEVLRWTPVRMAEGFRDAIAFALARKRRGEKRS